MASPHDPAITLLGINLNELEICVHTKTCSWMLTALFITAPKPQATRCPSTSEKGNQAVVHPSNGTVLSNKKRINTETYNNVDESPMHYGK